jgi:hypothetical protein
VSKTIIALATILCSATISSADLIYSLDYAVSGGIAPFTAPEGFQFLIQFPSFNDPGATKRFGQYEHVFWQDGASGSYDFTPALTADFGDLAYVITNGHDDQLGLLMYDSSTLCDGDILAESEWGLGHPDLAGNPIDLIRLVVHDLSVQPWYPFGKNGLIWNGHISWEFYGTPTPEPAAVVLMFGAALLLRRRLSPLGASTE